MAKKKPNKYPLAWERIGNIAPTPDEIIEINRIAPREKTRDLLKVFLMLRKRGESRKLIMALCDIGDRAFEKVNAMLNASQFLTSQVSLAQKYLVKQTATEDPEDAIDVEVVTTAATMDDAPAIMEQKVLLMLNAITDSKIADATLDEIANAIAKIFDKYRTATGQSNSYIAIGVSAVRGMKELDDKNLKRLLEQADKIQRALNAISERENKKPAASLTAENPGPDIPDQGKGSTT